MGRACTMGGEERNAYRLSMGKPEEKSPIRRPTFRWVELNSVA
jgi:hypothetical protein